MDMDTLNGNIFVPSLSKSTMFLISNSTFAYRLFYLYVYLLLMISLSSMMLFIAREKKQ